MSLCYHHPSIWHSCNFETGGMFNDTNGIPDRRFSIVEYHRSFVEYQHEIASSLEDADSFFPIPSISIDGDDRGKKRATQREDDELSISNHSKIAKLRGITFHASLFRFISKRNASPSDYSYPACMPLPPSFRRFYDRNRRRKPLVAPLPNGRIISRNQVKLSTVSSTLRPVFLFLVLSRATSSRRLYPRLYPTFDSLPFSPLPLLYFLPPNDCFFELRTRPWKRSRERICARKSSLTEYPP